MLSSRSLNKDAERTYSIALLHMQMSQRKPRNQTELYKCICPPCLFELEEGGKKSCVPKGNLDLCDLPSGVYSNPGTAGGCVGCVTM